MRLPLLPLQLAACGHKPSDKKITGFFRGIAYIRNPDHGIDESKLVVFGARGAIQGRMAGRANDLSRGLTVHSMPLICAVMVLSTQQITDAALKLSERERVRVTAALWKSLGGNDEALADIAALAGAHELESGQVQPKTQAEVFRNARASLG